RSCSFFRSTARVSSNTQLASGVSTCLRPRSLPSTTVEVATPPRNSASSAASVFNSMGPTPPASAPYLCTPIAGRRKPVATQREQAVVLMCVVRRGSSRARMQVQGGGGRAFRSGTLGAEAEGPHRPHPHLSVHGAPRARENVIHGCASSKDWCVQQET